MSIDRFFSYLTWLVFVSLFLVTTVRAARYPLRMNIDVALLFSAPALIIGIGVAATFDLIQPGPIPNAINSALLLLIAYLMLRLVYAFADVPRWLHWGALGLLVALSLGGFVFPPPRPAWFFLLQLLYFVGLELYAAVAFVRSSLRATGITRRRLQTIALGSFLLGLAIVASSLRELGEWWNIIFLGCALGSGISYFLGFVPPFRVRRSWQEPELREFLKTTTSLQSQPDLEAVLRALERGAAAAVGAPSARVGLWDEEAKVVRFGSNGHSVALVPTMETVPGRVFLTQKPVLSTNHSVDPAFVAQLSPPHKVRAMLAAPLTTGERRLGVLSVYAPKEAIFAIDDVELVGLLALQAATVLESRRLVNELAHIRAREEASRLKEDFLSSAAHDLKTPLTTLVAQAQFLERRMRRNPEMPVEMRSVELLVQESQRLSSLVRGLLEAAQAERGQLVGDRQPVDLVALAREVCARPDSTRHPCRVEASATVICYCDAYRVRQLIGHLIENAIMFSPAGGPVQILIWSDRQEAHLTITDQGIGIPPEDLPHLFERFYRGSNVNDRTFAGLGLSLFLCRAIAEQHGGRIEVESRLGQGSTFHVVLPLGTEEGFHASL